jgi:hypothetical protein
MQSFEAFYRVPAAHRLVPVRSRGRGGRFATTDWEHEEYDFEGLLIARYVSHARRLEDGVTQGGWRKYDPSGRLIAQGAQLPASLAEAA